MDEAIRAAFAVGTKNRGELSHLPDHTVVLYLTMFQDAAGKTFTPRRRMRRAAAPSSGCDFQRQSRSAYEGCSRLFTRWLINVHDSNFARDDRPLLRPS